MADQKFTALTALTAADEADLFCIVDDVAGTPTSKKIVLSEVRKHLDGQKGVYGTGGDADIEFNGTDLVVDFDHANSGTSDFRLQEDGTDRLVVLTGGKVGINLATPLANADLTLEGGALAIKETTTPSADTNYGKVYTKSDNKLYFQDGAGAEHEIQFV